jgi:hypothetical protein
LVAFAQSSSSVHAARDTSANAEKQISQLLQIFRIAPVTGAILSAALKCNSPDYEDAVLAEAVRLLGVDEIVTRNPTNFAKTGHTIDSPTDIVAMLEL